MTSDFNLIAALRKFGFSGDEMTVRGFRALARTTLAECVDWDESIVEAQLEHHIRNALGRSYKHTDFVEQRVEMSQCRAARLDPLRANATSPQGEPAIYFTMAPEEVWQRCNEVHGSWLGIDPCDELSTHEQIEGDLNDPSSLAPRSLGSELPHLVGPTPPCPLPHIGAISLRDTRHVQHLPAVAVDQAVAAIGLNLETPALRG